MKVAITHSSLCTQGGHERVPLLEAMFLQERNYDVSILASTFDERRCYPEMMKKLKLETYGFSLPFSLFGRGINHVFALSSMLKSSSLEKSDVLLCHKQPAPWFGYMAKRRANVLYIHYAHGVLRQLYPYQVDFQTRETWSLEYKLETSIFKRLKLIREFDMTAVRKADVILANSKYVAKKIKEIYDRSDAIICYPGVDFNKFRPLPRTETRYVVEKYSLGCPILLTTNRHESHKRLEWLIQMMPSIIAEHPSATLVMTGAYTRFYTPLLLNLARSLGIERNVVLTGNIPEQDLISLYNQSDAYVFSSPEEDFGYGPVEAMACGTSVVAWDHAGPAETVVNGITGLLATPYNLDDFRNRTLSLLEQRRSDRQVKTDCFEHVRRSFSWKRHINILERILKGIAS